jgi:hypothetical protein
MKRWLVGMTSLLIGTVMVAVGVLSGLVVVRNGLFLMIIFGDAGVFGLAASVGGFLFCAAIGLLWVWGGVCALAGKG